MFEITGCYENYCKSLMSHCLPSIFLLLVIMQAVILKNCFVHFTDLLPDTMCLKQQQPAVAKVLGRKLRLLLSQMLLLEICINVKEKIKRALYASSSYILGTPPIEHIKMSFEWAVHMNTDITLQTNRTGYGEKKSCEIDNRQRLIWRGYKATSNATLHWLHVNATSETHWRLLRLQLAGVQT